MFGDSRYGDRKAKVEAEDWEGPAFQTCADAAMVSRAFETSRRREVLSFTHHREVTPLSAEWQDKLLDEAEAKRLPVSALRQRVKEVRSFLAQGWTPSQLERKAKVEAGADHFFNVLDLFAAGCVELDLAFAGAGLPGGVGGERNRKVFVYVPSHSMVGRAGAVCLRLPVRIFIQLLALSNMDGALGRPMLAAPQGYRWWEVPKRSKVSSKITSNEQPDERGDDCEHHAAQRRFAWNRGAAVDGVVDRAPWTARPAESAGHFWHHALLPRQPRADLLGDVWSAETELQRGALRPISTSWRIASDLVTLCLRAHRSICATSSSERRAPYILVSPVLGRPGFRLAEIVDFAIFCV